MGVKLPIITLVIVQTYLRRYLPRESDQFRGYWQAMTNKELRKLTREDLLELLLEQAEAEEKRRGETPVFNTQ